MESNHYSINKLEQENELFFFIKIRTHKSSIEEIAHIKYTDSVKLIFRTLQFLCFKQQQYFYLKLY